jgi:hypothetical protein
VNVSFSDETRDVGGGEEDAEKRGAAVSARISGDEVRERSAQSHVVVADEANIEAVRAGELDVGAYRRSQSANLLSEWDERPKTHQRGAASTSRTAGLRSGAHQSQSKKGGGGGERRDCWGRG